MAEYIDRKALLDELCRDNCERTYDGTCHNCRMTDTIADFPASDVAEVRHGRWSTEACESVSKRNRLIKYRVYICSMCGRSNGRIKKRYCPNCGARMDIKEENNLGSVL